MDLSYKKVLVCIIMLSSLFIDPAKLSAQEKDSGSSFISLSYGADLVSRYVWRGNAIAAPNSDEASIADSASDLSMDMRFIPHIQPYVSLDFNFEEAGNLSLGAWGSYALKGKYSEVDFLLSYKVPFSFGNLGITLTDYNFPYNDSLSFFNFKGNGEGANTIEGAVNFAGPESFPLTLLVSKNVHNDPEGESSFYIEAGYPLTIDDVSLNFVIGAAKGVSAWHCVSSENLELTNIGFSVSKSIELNANTSIPVGLSFVLNPYLKQSYLFVKLSI